MFFFHVSLLMATQFELVHFQQKMIFFKDMHLMCKLV